MDKNTAYQVISQFKENNCKNEALANALDEALKALKPVATNNVYVVTLGILEKSSLCPSRYVSTDLWLEVTNDKKKMQAYIAEWRSKIVERCKDDNSSFEFDFHHGSPYNFTANKKNCNELPFYFEGKHYCFRLFETYKSLKSTYEQRVEHDMDAVQEIMSYLNL